jgi:transcriptional regulator with GAF, ATPase, and Fis domain
MLTEVNNDSKTMRTFENPDCENDQNILEKSSSAKRFLERFGNAGNNLEEFFQNILSNIAKEKEILQGVFLLCDFDGEIPKLRYLSGYACMKLNNEEDEFLLGEGLPGQVAKDGKLLNLKKVPEGYITIKTGLGSASPNSLIIFPIKSENKILGVIELASFHEFTQEDEEFFTSLSELIAAKMVSLIHDSINKKS